MPPPTAPALQRWFEGRTLVGQHALRAGGATPLLLALLAVWQHTVAAGPVPPWLPLAALLAGGLGAGAASLLLARHAGHGDAVAPPQPLAEVGDVWGAFAGMAAALAQYKRHPHPPARGGAGLRSAREPKDEAAGRSVYADVGSKGADSQQRRTKANTYSTVL